MPEMIVAVILGVTIYNIFKMSIFEITVAVILAIAIYNIFKMREKKALESTERNVMQKMKEEAQRRKQQEYEAYQHSLRQRLLGFVTNSAEILNSLLKDIKVAEHSIDEAEKEFTDGAFAPFWDAVENTVTHLALFNLGVQQIHDNFINYMNEKNKLDSTPPPFQINIGSLPIATRTSDRMRNIVRRAQKDFHFATIYEQRKTNQLLVKGFMSLGQALNDMTYCITTSIEDLSHSIYDLASSNSEDSRELIEGVESLRYQMQSDAEASRAHERDERKMLDNIQRGKKPIF
jgi:hypothetical protein